MSTTATAASNRQTEAAEYMNELADCNQSMLRDLFRPHHGLTKFNDAAFRNMTRAELIDALMTREFGTAWKSLLS